MNEETTYHIFIEDLASSAFLYLLTMTDRKFIRFTTLLEYAEDVLKCLKRRGLTAVLEYNAYYTAEFFLSNPTIFQNETDAENYDGIRILDDVTPQDIIERFMGSTAMAMWTAMRDGKILEKHFGAHHGISM